MNEKVHLLGLCIWERAEVGRQRRHGNHHLGAASIGFGEVTRTTVITIYVIGKETNMVRSMKNGKLGTRIVSTGGNSLFSNEQYDAAQNSGNIAQDLGAANLAKDRTA